MSAMKLINKPDHDPTNPYHYHDADGKKVVVTPEDWGKYKDDPTFREIRAAIEAEQSAYPLPEYSDEYNNYINNLATEVENQRGYNGGTNNSLISESYGKQLPKGYSRTERGLIIGPDGKPLVASKFRNSPKYTADFNNPTLLTFNKGLGTERNINYYPINVNVPIYKQPLPVDRVMDVNKAKEAAIKKYVSDNTYAEPIYYFDIFRFPSNILDGVRDKVLGWDFVVNNGLSEISREMVRRGLISDYRQIPDPNFRKSFNYLVGVTKDEIEKYHLQENIKDARQQQQALVNDESIIPKYRGETLYLEDFKKRKPTRQESEKKAVISIGPLERVNTFDTGGKLKLIPKAQVGIQLQPTNHYSFVAPDITIDNTRIYTPIHNEPTPKLIPREQMENFQNMMNHEFRERVLKKSPERFDPEAVTFNNRNGLYMWGALTGLKMLKKVPNTAWKSSLRGAALEAVTTVIDKQLQDADLITIENFLKKHPSLDRFLSYTGDIAGTLGSLAADAPDSKSRKAAKLLMLYGQIVDGIQGGASIHNMVENGVNLDDVFNTVVGVLPSTWNDTGVGIDDAVRNVSQGLGITNDVYQDVKNSNEETRRKLGK